MLSNTTGGASQSPSTADAATNKVTKVESSKAVKVKAEHFSSLSPENASNQAQAMSEDADTPIKSSSNSNNNNNNNSSNNNNCKNSTHPNSNNGTSGSSSEPGVVIPCSTAGGLRQNLSSANANSPLNSNSNNESDQLSANSNSSSNLSQIVTSEGDIQQDDLLKNKKNSVKEEDSVKSKLVSNHTNTSGNSAMEKGNQNNSATAGSNNKMGPVRNAATTPTIKEEPSDLLGSLVNMKKEDNFSPSMSPVGFGSIGAIGGPSGSSAPDRSTTPVKMELGSNITEKSTSVLGLNSNDDIVGCNALVSALDTERISEINSSNSHVTGGPISQPSGNASASAPGQGVSLGIGINVACGGVGGNPSNFVGSNSVGNALGNCLDYMQQQNHIFVFSTQLANNGAESVLSGQFQTIIAYHCTQPATKTFLEDFFMKNPMKMNKLQRQNSLGIGNVSAMSGQGGQPWLNSNSNTTNNSNLNANPNPNLAKMLQPQQKAGMATTLKSQFNSQAENNSNKRNTFADPVNETIVNESDLMCWETGNTSRNNLEASQSTSADSQALKLLEGVDSVLGKCNSDLSTDSNIISLQGVKVPDENLTPQQRQHREEQLAKIKKMNQFLFPENDNGSSQVNSKMSNDTSMGNIMMSMPGATNAQMRQMQMQMQAAQKTDHMSAQLSEDVLMPMPVALSADGIGEIGATISCNSGQKNNLSCGSTQGAASAPSGTGAGGGGINVNLNVGMQCSNSSNLIANSPEIMGGFGNTNCIMSSLGAGEKSGIGNQEGMPVPQGGMTPMEWTKLQQQFFEERLKVGKTACRPSGIPGPSIALAGPGLGPSPGPGTTPGVQQTPINTSTGGNAVSSIVSTQNSVMRNNSVQGPPPPYHPTQRSASVPIATQSPNPSSPNNLSLPSPRTSGALGLPSNSPNIELPTTNSSASVSATGNISAIAQPKNCFQNDAGSPSSRHRAIGNPPNVMSHHLNSNPSTPLAHLSPKELESYSSASSGGDLKATRPSPQRPRSPGNSVNSNSANHLIETNNLDSRFPASSPGVNFNAHTQIQNNTNTAINSYKGPNGSNSMERQNCGVTGPLVQFARRSDNMPLNPNSSNRPAQNKMAQNFDPISSLAQMSQQLTSCVSGVGSPAGGMNMMGPGQVDINMEHGGLVSNLDATGMDHMSHAPGGNNSCHPINPLINSMGQRMLNPKMTGIGPGFSPGPNGMVRDGNGPVPGPGFHGILPPGARMMSRMPVNFGPNFNPNIQVKASTPNTIQYMPVRPQSNNNSNNNGNNNANVRMTPSLEFLQRYANPQITNNVGGHAINNEGGGPMMIGSGGMNMNLPSDQQQGKMVNNHGGNNGIGMNFFQNCNQISGLDDEGSVVGVGMSAHDMGINQGPLIRGMRPHGMRQQGGLGVRMQAVPGGNIINRHQGQFPSGADSFECNDPSAMFNNGSGNCNNSSAMFVGANQPQQQGQAKAQQQHAKTMSAGLCNTQGVPNVGMQGASGVQIQGQGQAHHPGLGGPNSGNLMSSTGNSGGSGGGIGVNFVGPSSNDLKYAQQYHSFQQQLYATNTRSQQQQQQQQGGGGNMIPMPQNLSPNPAFFVNK